MSAVMPTSEQLMVEVAEKFLRKRSIEYALEVPFLDRSIDLVYVHDEALVSIEFKRHDWQRAIRQARDHQLGAEISFICLPEPRITERIVDAASRHGLGVLSWIQTEPLSTVVAADPPPDMPSSIGVTWLKEAFAERSGRPIGSFSK